MIDKFQGDPKFFINENGSRFVWINGQPIMDQWLENEILHAIFTPTWFGNSLFDSENEKFTSRLLETLDDVVTLESLNNIRDAIEKATNYIVETQKVKSIDVRVFNPRHNGITIEIIVTDKRNNLKLINFSYENSQWVRTDA